MDSVSRRIACYSFYSVLREASSPKDSVPVHFCRLDELVALAAEHLGEFWGG